LCLQLSVAAETVKHKWKWNDNSPQAVAEATAAIGENPHDADAYLRRAEARGDEKSTLHLSLQDVNRAIALGGEHARYYSTKASILDQLEDDKEAFIAIDKACKLEPGNGHYWHMRSIICYHLKKNDEALRSAEESIRLVPNNAGYRQYKARALRAMGKLQECLPVLDTAIKLEPSHIPLLKDRMDVHTRLKQWNQVVEDCNRILKIEKGASNLSDILQSRAHAYRQLKQYPKAIEDLKRAETLFPDDRRSHADLLEIYELTGDKQNAERERKLIKSMDEDFAPPK